MNDLLIIKSGENEGGTSGVPMSTKFTVAKGDGIGPEIMEATFEL